uniref:Wall-associated receptor kinase C-terminal domain-containing protein n=1 Tax=Populus alba TaxID=43335 RepID=A0A4U5PSU3_POPAL|nr:hypothetical protein D5086_0000182870 [Populus alba]
MPVPGLFTCKINAVNYQIGYIQGGATGPGDCYGSVFVPVSIAELSPVVIMPDLEHSLKEGFEVRWKVDGEACRECNSFSGVCGVDSVTNQTTCYCPNQSSGSRTCAFLPAPGTSAAAAAILTLSIITIYLTRREGSFSAVIGMTFRLKKLQHVGRVETFMMDYHSLIPKRYSYSDIKKMTKSFVNTLGEGGFGNVYRGKLPDDGRLVAVKILKESKDFDLAKLCQSKVSKISMIGARGTVGYIVPEVFCRFFGGVTYKSDVYNYGMMVLEMVEQSKDFDMGSLETNKLYFPDWFYIYLDPGEISTFHRGTTEEEKEIVKKMILVGLWCIQTIPSHRPSMTKVVEMFEGSIQSLQIPPRPSLSSPKRFTQEHSSTVSSLPCVSSQGYEVNKLPADESDF